LPAVVTSNSPVTAAVIRDVLYSVRRSIERESAAAVTSHSDLVDRKSSKIPFCDDRAGIGKRQESSRSKFSMLLVAPVPRWIKASAPSGELSRTARNSSDATVASAV